MGKIALECSWGGQIIYVEVLGCCSFRKDTGCYTWLGVESTFCFLHPLGGRPQKGWVLPVCTQGSQTPLRRGRRHPGKQSLEVSPQPCSHSDFGACGAASSWVPDVHLLIVNEPMQPHPGRPSLLSASIGVGTSGTGESQSGYQRGACLEARCPNSWALIGDHAVLALSPPHPYYPLVPQPFLPASSEAGALLRVRVTDPLALSRTVSVGWKTNP